MSFFVAGFAAAMLILGGINICIDPFGLFRVVEVQGFNNNRQDVAQEYANVFKMLEVKLRNPKQVVIGSSRTQIGMNMDYFSDGLQVTGYNMGLPGLNMYQVVDVLEHTIKNSDVKQVILGLDFLKQAVISASALRASYRVFKQSRGLPALPELRRNGQWVRSLNDGKTADDRYKSSAFIHFNRRMFYLNYEFSDKTFEELEKFVKLARRRDIEVFLYISPIHALHLEVIRISGLWQDFLAWKRKLAFVSEKLNVSIHDFAVYSRITTGPVGDLPNGFYDTSHFEEGIGKLVLDRIFKNAPELDGGFGALVRVRDIDFHLNNSNHLRSEYVGQLDMELKELYELCETTKMAGSCVKTYQ